MVQPLMDAALRDEELKVPLLVAFSAQMRVN